MHTPMDRHTRSTQTRLALGLGAPTQLPFWPLYHSALLLISVWGPRMLPTLGTEPGVSFGVTPKQQPCIRPALR